MKFGARFYGVEPNLLLKKAQLAEAVGFESIWRGDHLIIPSEVSSSYPYDTKQRFQTEAPILDVIVTLGFLAAGTSTLRLATGVYILPLRDVYATARALQTLDILSKGRVIFGVGVGWLAEEFDIVGRAFSDRAAIADEAIEVLNALWQDAEPSFDGDHFSFPPVRFEPKPVQQPRPPIVFGGESRAALRRAAYSGDGWYGHRPKVHEVRDTIRRLDTYRVEAGRADVPFEITVRISPGISIEEVQRFADAGVNRLVLELGAFTDVYGESDLHELERFGNHIIDRW